MCVVVVVVGSQELGNQCMVKVGTSVRITTTREEVNVRGKPEVASTGRKGPAGKVGKA